jgi:ribosomal protein S18 acetylase RimI-like enzyme
MNEILYRKVTQQDIPQIIELWKEFIDFHKARDPFFSRSEEGPENFGKYISDNLQKDNAAVYIAESSKKIVAYMLCIIQDYPPAFITKDYGLLSDLAVAAEYRRQGVGEHLFYLASAWFAEKGIKRIEIGVASANEVSTSFWAKMGFKPYKNICYFEI